jgi:cation:H+ antiporter
MVWLQFLICGVVIAWAGSRLSYYGNLIAERSGSNGTWVGVILLATATSLPELVTGLSSAGLADSPDIAIGNVVGSCVYNLAILAVVDAIYRHESIYTRASQGHILGGGFGVILLGVVGLDLVVSTNGRAAAIGHVGVSSLVLVVLYVVATRSVFRYEREHHEESLEAARSIAPSLSGRDIALRYTGWSSAVLVVGLWLPFVGQDIAAAMGWHESLVGTLFITAITCAPELAVTIAAARAGALDLAIGNLLGSNLFNLLIVALDDVVYLEGPLLAHGSPVHAGTVFTAVMMTGVAIVGLRFRPRTQLFNVIGWASLALVSLYALNVYLFYLVR